MVRPMGNRPKWLAALIILVLATLFISGCPSSSQSPADQPPTDEPPTGQPLAEQTPTGQLPTDEPPANQPPVIDSLTSRYIQVKRATEAPVECSASDPDGDELSYAWSATGGSISGEGAAVSWMAPEQSGTYTITVTVADGRGGQDTESLEIGVSCCPIKADE